MATKRVKKGDQVVLTGTVTRVGDDEGESTLITVLIDGLSVPVTLPEKYVRRA